MKVLYPKVKVDSFNRVFISFYQNEKRYRLYNGSKINSSIYPNAYSSISKRIECCNILAAEVYQILINGISIEQLKYSKLLKPNMTDKEYLSAALDIKLNENYTTKYKYMLRFIHDKLVNEMNNSSLESSHIWSVLSSYTSETSYNTYLRRIGTLVNEANKLGMSSNPMKEIKSKRSKASLHKYYSDISQILNDIKTYNSNLYLCCLMTYGCLLRPHREIRELTWTDFSDDLSHINLSGHRNKSGRNRIVPVPSYIRELLVKGEPSHNIFSGKPQPFNEDYFKTLWSRFKSKTKSVDIGQTLYSFRHSGAIDIFKRTGSLTKLQKAMGHSSINVSLTYLRGLEVAELTEDDMPLL